MNRNDKIIKLFPKAKELFELGYDYNEVVEIYDRQNGLDKLEAKKSGKGEYVRKRLITNDVFNPTNNCL